MERRMASTNADERSLGKGKFLELIAIGKWEFARRIHGTTPVGIVAVTPARELLLISQFRIPLGKTIVEIPAGLVGDGKDHAESWKTAAARELQEETGYTAADFDELMVGPTSAGMTSECIRLVWARNVTRAGDPTPDGDEQIDVHLIPLANVESFLAARVAVGCLIDPKVYAALYFAAKSHEGA
jgi:ADP-ribose pyrophosphatase